MGDIKSGERVAWVDIVKGIVMIGAVLEHCIANNVPYGPLTSVEHFFGSFDMPCFFMIAGVFAKKEEWKVFFVKKWNSLMLPFFFVFFLFYIIGLTIESTMPGVLKNDVTIWNLICSHTFTNGPIWFLSSLFMALTLLQVVFRIENKWARLAFVAAIGTLGYYWRTLFDFRLPMFWDTSLTALMFVYAGTFARQLLERQEKWSLYIVAIVGLILPFVISRSLCKQYNENYGLILLSVPVVMVTCAGVLAAAKLLGKSKALEFVGRNSIIYLCFHNVLVLVVIRVLNKVGLISEDGILLCFVIVMTIMAFASGLIRRYLKFIFR